MKWFKPIFLAGAMAVVTWGVWHTLTHQGPKPDSSEEPSPKWARDNARAKSGSGSPRSGDGTRYDPPRNDGGGAGGALEDLLNVPRDGVPRDGAPREGGANPAPGNAGIGPFDPGSAAPSTPEGGREGIKPRFAGQVPPPAGGPTPPKEDLLPTATTANIETQRLNDQFDTVIKRAKEQKAARQFKPVYEELSGWYAKRDDLTLARSAQLLKELDDLALEVVYSARPYLSPPYVVAPGDTLSRIATPQTVPPELIIKINSIGRPDQIRPGQSLKVVPGPFHAEVRLSKYELTMLIGEKKLYAGRFRFGLGKEGPFQPGVYTVLKKKMFPEYYPDPSNREYKIPGGDPHNALGTRLIVFASADGKLDGAMHGTIEPGSIGGPCKEGSIRMSREDIENVYDMLVENESKITVLK